MVRFLPQVGFDSEYTQLLANAFPPWHRIRYDATSTGQDVLNAFALGMSEVQQYLKYTRRNLFLKTADTLVRTHAYRCEVPQKIKTKARRSENYLRNATLRDQGQAFWNQPLEWQVTSGEFYSVDGYAGHGSVKLSPEGVMYQVVSGESFRSGQNYTASVFVKSSGETEPLRGTIKLVATGWGWEQEDDFTFKLGTTGEWVQQFITMEPTGEIRSLRFEVRSQPTGELDVLFSAPTLQEGSQIGGWQPGNDYLAQNFRVSMVGATGEEQQRIELRQVQNEFDLFEDALPTRLVASPGITGETVSSNFAPPVWEANADFWECEFRVSGEYIERYSARLDRDVWNQYSILDRYMDNEVNTGEYGYTTAEYSGFTRTLEALCVWRRRIYLVCKESYGGSTYRVLKVLRWQGIDDNLETITDLRVGMDTGDVSSVEFVEGRVDQLALTMSDDTQWTMSMYYDVFLYDSDRRQLLVRHPYTGYTLTFVEI